MNKCLIPLTVILGTHRLLATHTHLHTQIIHMHTIQLFTMFSRIDIMV